HLETPALMLAARQDFAGNCGHQRIDRSIDSRIATKAQWVERENARRPRVCPNPKALGRPASREPGHDLPALDDSDLFDLVELLSSLGDPCRGARFQGASIGFADTAKKVARTEWVSVDAHGPGRRRRVRPCRRGHIDRDIREGPSARA